MSDLNIQIAQLCLSLFEIHETYRGGKLVKYVTGKGDEDLIEVSIDSDLNACAEFEKMLTFEQCEVYHKQLELQQADDTKDRNGETEYPAQDFWFHATAEQRCRAFILCHSQNESR